MADKNVTYCIYKLVVSLLRLVVRKTLINLKFKLWIEWLTDRQTERQTDVGQNNITFGGGNKSDKINDINYDVTQSLIN